jgi:hypothetical protein
MRYEILGPLRVVDGDDVSFLTARKIEVLLAVLLIRADQLVPSDQLSGEIWERQRAAAGLHVYISQLRKARRMAGAAGGHGTRSSCRGSCSTRRSRGGVSSNPSPGERKTSRQRL